MEKEVLKLTLKTKIFLLILIAILKVVAKWQIIVLVVFSATGFLLQPVFQLQ